MYQQLPLHVRLSVHFTNSQINYNNTAHRLRTTLRGFWRQWLVSCQIPSWKLLVKANIPYILNATHVLRQNNRANYLNEIAFVKWKLIIEQRTARYTLTEPRACINIKIISLRKCGTIFRVHRRVIISMVAWNKPAQKHMFQLASSKQLCIRILFLRAKRQPAKAVERLRARFTHLQQRTQSSCTATLLTNGTKVADT